MNMGKHGLSCVWKDCIVSIPDFKTNRLWIETGNKTSGGYGKELCWVVNCCNGGHRTTRCRTGMKVLWWCSHPYLVAVLWFCFPRACVSLMRGWLARYCCLFFA